MTATRRNSLFAAALVVATLFIYWPVVGFEFVDFDDDVYITDNPVVRSGLSARGVLWAFTSGHAANWHPLTWLSHMLDVSLFGLAAGAHHATNLLFHLANTLLVFLFFARTTGHTATSAVVALFFGIHPLHVESVAWVSERKDVLSAFFGLGTLLFYAEWVTNRRPRDYALALCSFGAGLMAKPILVTLPFVLVLIDLWPLGRPDAATRQAIVSRLREKTGFFALAITSSIITFVVQRSWGAMEIGHAIALPDRLANAVVSYARYLGKTFWPTELSLLYPHPYAPGGLPWSAGQIVGALVLLLAISAIVIAWRRYPYLAVGWFWFVGMLVPVIGIVQVGGQAMADRYTYLPHIGLFAALAFAARALSETHGLVRSVTLGLLVLALVSCLNLARQQTAVWRDSLTLLGHASTITPGNPIMNNHLGTVLQARGRYDEAIRHYRRALQFDPDNPKTHSNLGRTLQLAGRGEEAVAHFRHALEIVPSYAHALMNLGVTMANQGRLIEAEALFRRAIESQPDAAEAHANLGATLRIRGKAQEATVHFNRAIEIAPDNPTTLYGYGQVLSDLGRHAEAVSTFERVLAIQPEHPSARREIARLQREVNEQR